MLKNIGGVDKILVWQMLCLVVENPSENLKIFDSILTGDTNLFYLSMTSKQMDTEDKSRMEEKLM